jgi:hypothetical protein
VFPAGWLPAEAAARVAESLRADSDPGECRRFAGGRVDCLDFTDPGCRTVSVRYARERLRWGAYAGCEPRAHPRLRRAVHALRRREWHCPEDVPCRPRWFGRVPEARLIPTD